MKKPFSPETWTEEAKSISDEWASLEDDLLKYQSNRLCENANVDIDEWLLKKLMNPKATISDITNIINRHKPIIDSITKKSLDTAADYAKEYVTSTLNVSISRQDLSGIKNVLDENNNMYNIILTKNVQAANTLPSLVRNEYKLANGNKVFTMEKATETLYKAISKVTDRELSRIIGVNYKDGRKVSFKSYMEMRVRTDINNVAIDMMERASSSLGVVLFLASYFGDCAPDHKDYQGKVYILENWRSIVAQEDIEKYQALIDRKGIQTLEWVKEQGTYTTDTGKKYLIALGTRPNCRHTFTPITYDQACNEQKTLEELNLKYHGGYDKGKYGNMQQARFNERKIRDLKLKHQETLSKIANCGDKDLLLKFNDDLKSLNYQIKWFQHKQIALIGKNDYLNRLYKRETPNNMAYNLGVNEELTPKNLSAKILVEELSEPLIRDNASIRQWYVSSLDSIKDKLDILTKGYSLERKAKTAFTIRNMVKYKARSLMDDTKEAEQLYVNETSVTFQSLVDKYTGKGMTKAESYKHIYESLSKTRTAINEKFNVKRGKKDE